MQIFSKPFFIVLQQIAHKSFYTCSAFWGLRSGRPIREPLRLWRKESENGLALLFPDEVRVFPAGLPKRLCLLGTKERQTYTRTFAPLAQRERKWSSRDVHG